MLKVSRSGLLTLAGPAFIAAIVCSLTVSYSLARAEGPIDDLASSTNLLIAATRELHHQFVIAPQSEREQYKRLIDACSKSSPQFNCEADLLFTEKVVISTSLGNARRKYLEAAMTYHSTAGALLKTNPGDHRTIMLMGLSASLIEAERQMMHLNRAEQVATEQLQLVENVKMAKRVFDSSLSNSLDNQRRKFYRLERRCNSGNRHACELYFLTSIESPIKGDLLDHRLAYLESSTQLYASQDRAVLEAAVTGNQQLLDKTLPPLARLAAWEQVQTAVREARLEIESPIPGGNRKYPAGPLQLKQQKSPASPTSKLPTGPADGPSPPPTVGPAAP